MKKEFAGAQKEVDSLTRTLDRKRAVLSKNMQSMKESNIEVGNLSAEEKRLADAIKQVATEASQMASTGDFRKALDIPSHEAVNAEVNKLRAQYAQLKKEGKLSWTENAQAAVVLNDKILELQRSTGNWKDSLSQAKGEILQATAAMGGIGFAVKQAIDFESAMADVAKVAEGTDEQLAQLSDELQNMSTELPLSAQALAEIAQFGAQLGVPIEKLKQFTDTAAKMAVAFDMTAEQAGQSMATLSTSFNIPIERIGELGDSINTLSNKAGVAAKNIVEVANRTAGTATNFGLTADQVIALETAFLKTGRTSETTATAINSMLNTLKTLDVQSEKAQMGLRQMGVDATQFAAKLSTDPQQALLEFLETLDTLDSKTRSEALFRIFGRGMSDDIALLVTQLDRYKTLLGQVSDKTQVAGSMQREDEARAATTANQLNLLKNAVTNVAINLGSIFLPMIKAAAEKTADLTNAIAGLVKEYPSLSILTTTMLTVASAATAMKVAFLAARLAGVKSFADLALGAKALRSPINKATDCVNSLGKALGLVGAATVGWEFGSWARKNLKPVYVAGVRIAQAFTLGFNAIEKMYEAGKAFAKGDFDKLGEIADQWANDIEGINQHYGELANDFELNANKLKTDQESVTSVIEATQKAIAELENKQLEIGVNEEVSAEIEQLKAKLNQLKTETSTATEGSINEIKEQVAQVNAGIDGIKEKYDKIASGYNTADALMDSLKGRQGSVEAIMTTISAGIEKVNSQDLPQLINGLQGAFTQGKEAGSASLDELRAELATFSQQAISEANAVEAAQQTAQQTRIAYLQSEIAKFQLASDQTVAANERVTSEALSRLGMDASKMLGLVSEESLKMSGAFEAAVIGMSNMRLAAEQQSTIIRQALDVALDNSKSQADIDALNERIRRLGENGQLSGQQMQQALEDTGRKAKQLAGDLTGIEDAFEQLGIKSQQMMQAEADKMKQAFSQVEQAASSGKASTEDVKNAFMAYASQVVSNSRSMSESQQTVEMSVLKSKAAALGLNEEFSKLEATATSAGNSAARSMDKVASSAGNAAAKMAQAGQSAGEHFSEGMENGLKTSNRFIPAVAANAIEAAKAAGEGALAELSSQFEGIGQIVDLSEGAQSVELLDQAIKSTSDTINQMADDMARYGDSGQSVRLVAEQAKLATLEQKRAVAQLTEQYKKLDASQQTSRIDTEAVLRRFNKLDDSDLSGLRSEIERVNSGVKDVEKSVDNVSNKAGSATDKLKYMADALQQEGLTEVEKLRKEMEQKIKEIDQLKREGGSEDEANRAASAVRQTYDKKIAEANYKAYTERQQKMREAASKTVKHKVEIPGSGSVEFTTNEKDSNAVNELIDKLTRLKKSNNRVR